VGSVKPDFLFLLPAIKMKYKLLLFLLIGFSAIILLVNSCKKDNSGSIQTLFTGGNWQLASCQVAHFVGDTLKTTDTLYTTCSLNQVFTFNSNLTCTYTNYSCSPQPTATGHWSLSSNQLYLASDMTVKDTTSVTGSSMPFSQAQIVNLGLYSLVLQTGDLELYYPSNKKRTITRYGFVRQKNP